MHCLAERLKGHREAEKEGCITRTHLHCLANVHGYGYWVAAEEARGGDGGSRVLGQADDHLQDDYIHGWWWWWLIVMILQPQWSNNALVPSNTGCIPCNIKFNTDNTNTISSTILAEAEGYIINNIINRKITSINDEMGTLVSSKCLCFIFLSLFC